jgi:hypothetical protein
MNQAKGQVTVRGVARALAARGIGTARRGAWTFHYPAS